MVSIKNIALTGASGTLGQPVLKALIDSGKFNITALTRETSNATFPTSVRVAKVNFDSLESLTAVLKGQDAVVSLVGSSGLQGQSLVVEAAVAAGVKRFIPSEFGSDTNNPKAAQLPVFALKVATQKYVKAKAASNPDFTYTLIHNGPFLDWGIQVGFLVNKEKTRVFDGGDQLFSATTLPSVGQAVVGVLTHFEETKNRGVYVEDLHISQNRLLEIGKKVLPDQPFEAIPTKLADITKAADEKLAKGDQSVLYEYLASAVYGEGFGALYTKLDNELLGITGKTEADVETYFK